MERHFKPYEKECMRMAMLKHEETFKQQVYELHRLYRIQKILMKSIESNTRPQERTRKNPSDRNGNGLDQFRGSLMKHKSGSIKLDLERHVDDYIAEANGDGSVLEMIVESEIELTLGLGPSTYHTSKKAETTPLNSDCGPSSFTSSSTGSSHVNKASSGAHERMPERFTRGHESISVQIEVEEEQLRQEKLKQKHPPWLFQVMSLNMA